MHDKSGNKFERKRVELSEKYVIAFRNQNVS